MAKKVTPKTDNNKRKKKPKDQAFTDPWIKSLPAEDVMYQVREGKVNPGFGVRVLPTKTKSWFYVYDINGTRRQMSLGNYPDVSLSDARKKYREAFDIVATGVDPQAPPPAVPALLTNPTVDNIDEEDFIDPNMTIATLIEKYKKHIEKTLVERSVYDQYRTLTVDVKPKWGERRVREIKRVDAIRLLERKADVAPGQSRNILKAARAMYTFAVFRDFAEFNPFIGTMEIVPQIKPKARKRWLNTDEIRIVWNRLYSERMTFIQRILLLTLLTGQRPGEAGRMEWSELEFGQGHVLCNTCAKKCAWWTIPPEKIKTEAHLDNEDPEPFRVYLAPFAVSLLPEQSTELRSAGIHWVFPSTDDLPTRVTSLSKYTRKNFKDMTPWTPNDLRRSFASHLPSMGCSQEHIDKVQNHVIAGVGKVYNQYQYDAEKQYWLLAWSMRLQEITA